MQEILIVTEKNGYLISSLEQKLTEAGFKARICGCTPNDISAYTETVDAILLFIEESTNKHCSGGLIYLKDVALEKEIPIFLTGDSSEIEVSKSFIPNSLVSLTFPRPINIIVMTESIGRYLKDHEQSDRKTILVVDDNGTMLRNVKGWLGERYNVIPVNSGARAIQYLASNHPDLILLDYEMPVVDGKQVLEMIRSEMDFADIPVFFLTSKGDRESVLQVMSLRPEGYLLKSMPPAQIIATIDEFFEKEKIKKNNLQ